MKIILSSIQTLMYHVKFPGLNLEFDIDTVAFSLGSITIRWYGIFIALGFLLAFFYVMKRGSEFKLNSDHLTEAIIVGLVTAIIGARLYYIIFYPDNTYIKDPLSIFKINEGGIAIYGAILGGLIGGLSVAKIRKMNLFAVMDISALGFLIGQSIGRWGNFTNQEAFGVATNLPWRMASEATGGIGVHPCFLYESLWCLVGFILLHFFSNQHNENSDLIKFERNEKINPRQQQFKTFIKCLCAKKAHGVKCENTNSQNNFSNYLKPKLYQKYQGQIFLIYLLWYGTERFFVEGLRTDSLLIPALGIRVSQIIAIVTALIALAILLFNHFKRKKHNLI